MKLFVVLYTSHNNVTVEFSSLLAVIDVLRNDGGDLMKLFLKDFLYALSACLQLGIAVPILLIALFGPTSLIIVAILWGLDVI